LQELTCNGTLLRGSRQEFKLKIAQEMNYSEISDCAREIWQDCW